MEDEDLSEEEWIAERAVEGLVFVVAFDQAVNAMTEETRRIIKHLVTTAHPGVLAAVVALVEIKLQSEIDLSALLREIDTEYEEFYSEHLPGIRVGVRTGE